MVRRAFHISSVIVLAILALLLSRETALWLFFALASLTLVADIVRLSWPYANRFFGLVFRWLVRDEEMNQLNGSTYLTIGALLTLMLFDHPLAVMALFFLAVGDPAASLAGERWGRHKLGNKSCEGTAAFFISSLVTGLILKYTALDISLWVLVAGSFSAAIVELVSLPINDNLTIPLIAAAILSGLTAV